MCGAFYVKENCNAHLTWSRHHPRCDIVNFRAMGPISALLTGVSVP